MNQYQSVKDATEPSVKAFKIRSMLASDNGEIVTIRSQGDAFDPIDVPAHFMEDQAPHVGGYLIVQADDTFKFLPAEEFETDYMRIDA